MIAPASHSHLAYAVLLRSIADFQTAAAPVMVPRDGMEGGHVHGRGRSAAISRHFAGRFRPMAPTWYAEGDRNGRTPEETANAG